MYQRLPKRTAPVYTSNWDAFEERMLCDEQYTNGGETPTEQSTTMVTNIVKLLLPAAAQSWQFLLPVAVFLPTF